MVPTFEADTDSIVWLSVDPTDQFVTPDLYCGTVSDLLHGVIRVLGLDSQGVRYMDSAFPELVRTDSSHL